MSTAHASLDLPQHAHGRKATWFELFFDLVFVVAVAQLSGAYAHHFDWPGAAGSALLLLYCAGIAMIPLGLTLLRASSRKAG